MYTLFIVLNTYDTDACPPWAANCRETWTVVPSTGDKHHIVLLHGLSDHLTNPPGTYMDKITKLNY